jgi:hypothetical protein
MHLENIGFDYAEEKGPWDATGMLGKISELTLEIAEKCCACFIEWQKTLDRAK